LGSGAYLFPIFHLSLQSGLLAEGSLAYRTASPDLLQQIFPFSFVLAQGQRLEFFKLKQK
jgi:hypothetical protein